ncbi:PAS domain-containing protein [Isachenkonia alkalipeptolytica]|nr:PAS domain-containing protein [Isachenkonia alkalipeptolytica]
MTRENSYKDTDSYLNLLDNALIGVFHTTAEGKFLYVNKALANMFKYESPEDLISSINNIEKQLFARKQNRQELLEIVRSTGKLLNCEVEYLCKDGSTITALLNMQFKHDEEGNELFLEGFINDITFIKEKERAIMEREER